MMIKCILVVLMRGSSAEVRSVLIQSMLARRGESLRLLFGDGI